MWYKMAKDYENLKEQRKLVACVIIFKKKDDDIFVLLEKKQSGQWAIPGGHVEVNESPEEAAVREIEEETSLSLKTKKLHLIEKLSKDKSDTKLCNIYAYHYKKDKKPVAGSDVDHLDWFPVNDLPEVLWNGKNNIKKALKVVFDDVV